MIKRLLPAALICFIAVGGFLAAATDAPVARGEAKSKTPQAKGEFPAQWFYPDRSTGLRGLEGKPAKPLKATDWIGDSQKIAALKGKVVVVDFWATWCPPCRASIPHNVAMTEKYKDRGFMLIGIHSSGRGSEKMPAMAKDQKINYPLAVDQNGTSAKAYHVGFLPTYVIIDRKGVVRAAGVEPGSVEKIVEKLIEETVPNVPQA